MDDLTKKRAYEMLKETSKDYPIVAELMQFYMEMKSRGEAPVSIMNAMLSMSMGFFVTSCPEHASELFALLQEMHYRQWAVVNMSGVTAKQVHDAYVESEYVEKQKQLFKKMYPEAFTE